MRLIRPLGIGRRRVRAMRSSMSRSMYMFTAFAPPAIRYPPTSTISTSASSGLPATNIGAIVVTSSSEMMRGLVSITRSCSSVRPAGAGATGLDVTLLFSSLLRQLAVLTARFVRIARTTTASHTSVPNA